MEKLSNLQPYRAPKFRLKAATTKVSISTPSPATETKDGFYASTKRLAGDLALGGLNFAISKLVDSDEIKARNEGWLSSWAPDDFDSKHLASFPAAKMERPLLMVPGWRTAQDRFVPAAKTIAGEDKRVVYVKNGEFFSDTAAQNSMKKDDINSQDSVFVVVHEYAGDAPTKTAPAIAKSISAIKQATGHDSVDAMGFSQGGLALVEYAKNGGEVNSFFSLGSPHQGSSSADLLHRVSQSEERGYSVEETMGFFCADGRDRDSLAYMRRSGPSIAENKERWPEIKTRLGKTKFVAADGHKTSHSDSKWLLRLYTDTAPGDGKVALEAAAPPGEELHVVSQEGKYTEHDTLPYNREVVDLMYKHFGYY